MSYLATSWATSSSLVVRADSSCLENLLHLAPMAFSTALRSLSCERAALFVARALDMASPVVGWRALDRSRSSGAPQQVGTMPRIIRSAADSLSSAQAALGWTSPAIRRAIH